ncbi:MAG: glycosyltransferase family 2 protein [Verrucomicrobiota bacterium]|nr:glycosyltransferase family 2 protein [Verrucomicrobiota bacterium]
MAESPLPISVCIIASNEGRRIRRALDSVAGWVAEIVVVIDDKVTDGTDKIAESYGAKIFSRLWEGHAVHRNFASGKATQPWHFALDVDEVVSPKLRAEIVRVISGADASPDSAVAYGFPRCTFYHGRWIRHGDWYPDRKVRIWRREAGRWEGSPHEKLIVQGRVQWLHGDLLHYSMESLEHIIKKTISTADYFLQQYEAQGRKVSFADLAFRPWWSFFRSYFLRLGFLDGWQGYVIAWMTSFYTFLRYAKVYIAQIDTTQTS